MRTTTTKNPDQIYEKAVLKTLKTRQQRTEILVVKKKSNVMSPMTASTLLPGEFLSCDVGRENAGDT